MKRDWYIDGFNFFHGWSRTRELFLHSDDIVGAVDRGLHMLAGALDRRRGRALVVLDGGLHPKQEVRAGLRVQYAGPKSNADRLILELLREADDPRRIALVTDDRPLGGGAHAMGAEWITVDDFAASLDADAPASEEEPRRKFLSPTKNEVEEFLDIFGDGSDIMDEEGL